MLYSVFHSLRTSYNPQTIFLEHSSGFQLDLLTKITFFEKLDHFQLVG